MAVRDEVLDRLEDCDQFPCPMLIEALDDFQTLLNVDETVEDIKRRWS